MDIKNAFLNGDLHEEVYIIPPPGLDHHPGEVCKLRKALYSLKQAPHACFEKFPTVITSLSFHPSNYDSALFIKSTSASQILLSLYVDDMIIIGDDVVGISMLKFELTHYFSMKDLGPLRYFLGIKVASSPKGYLLSQSKYIFYIFEHACLSNNKTADTPIELNTCYSVSDGSSLPDPSLYRTIVGSLAIVLRILKYLYDTQFQTLLLSSTSSLELCAYSDADWAGDPTDRKSTTGFSTMKRGNISITLLKPFDPTPFLVEFLVVSGEDLETHELQVLAYVNPPSYEIMKCDSEYLPI
eukprot:XP_015579409.1 uncharacterized protein LOC107261852 [Ricinus communis]